MICTPKLQNSNRGNQLRYYPPIEEVRGRSAASPEQKALQALGRYSPEKLDTEMASYFPYQSEETHENGKRGSGENRGREEPQSGSAKETSKP